MRILRIALSLPAIAVLVGCGQVAPLPTSAAPTPTSIETRVPQPSPTPSGDFDSGPRDGAMGPIELNANGTATLYTVVEGDYADAICYRFDLAREQLVFAETDAPVDARIYPGDVIRFLPLPKDEDPYH